MDSTATLKDAEEKLKALNLAAIVMKTAETKNLNFAKLSKLMHKSDSFVSARLGRKKLSMPILFALSQHLQTNLFEPYTNLLPEAVRATAHEKQLQLQITDLQKQLDDMRKERDLLKEIVMK